MSDKEEVFALWQKEVARVAGDPSILFNICLERGWIEDYRDLPHQGGIPWARLMEVNE